MGDALFLHEVVDIVGQGSKPYMAHTVGFDTDDAGGRGLRLFGTWSVMGSTGRWPQVVNLWELIDGWEGWRRLCDRTNLQRDTNPGLSQWWDEAHRYRTGGFDRLLMAADSCPTPCDLVSARVTGTVFVHELTEVRPGAGPDYLDAVAREWAPVAAEHGHTLVGSWLVLLRDTEVCTLWATDLDHHIALMDSSDERATRWAEHRRQWCTRWRTELMTPGAGTLLAPAPPG
ncbi:MAG: hypothetical protein WKF43_17000 [Acidimicrobiales bacterium]